MQLLSELMAKANLTAPVMGDATVRIDAITTDSRKVKAGGDRHEKFGAAASYKIGGSSSIKGTDVVVEDLSGKDDLQTRRDRYAQYEPEFRQNYSQTYANSEYDYDRVAPAYRFGTELGNLDQQKDWQALESDARTHWETKSPGTWDRMKDAIRYAWERVRASVSG